jgi:hypothetical protein
LPHGERPGRSDRTGPRACGRPNWGELLGLTPRGGCRMGVARTGSENIRPQRRTFGPRVLRPASRRSRQPPKRPSDWAVVK